MIEITLILNNIRSNENVGSIFRTADAAHVKKIYLCGYTPAPVDRFGRANKALVKAALGAEKNVDWGKIETLRETVAILKKEKFQIVAIEQTSKSKNYSKYKYSKKTALVLGNEVDGLSANDLSLCDVAVEIPMNGLMVGQAHHPRHTKQGKESLNVAVTAGIALFNIRS
jgi:23S rRNA (guanosine2251-2'-O)-methyltransferase